MDSLSRASTNCRPPVGGLTPDEHAAGQVPVKKQGVKRHHHKHNLKHRYDFLETLGKGTYGKVKKAKERSGRLVSVINPTSAAVAGIKVCVCPAVALATCCLQSYY